MEHPPTVHKTPEHESTYRRLRDMVLLGQLAPGQKVTIHGIAQALGAGMTPVREAIRRLTAEGALALHENRRVSVPRLTLEQVDELAIARLAIEPQLARRAALRKDAELAERLATIDAEIDRAIVAGDVQGYLTGNARFHFVLYEAARAPILLGLTRALWLRIGPSLRVMMETGGPSGPDRHRETVAALRACRPEAVASAIAEDIEQGLSRLRAALAGG
ncbi:MAG: GntR family transcriptional regulator [Rhodobacteraceae bacterium]|nr:GntR family transcriptional regulator [Paracoccaceae bacterium]